MGSQRVGHDWATFTFTKDRNPREAGGTQGRGGQRAHRESPPAGTRWSWAGVPTEQTSNRRPCGCRNRKRDLWVLGLQNLDVGSAAPMGRHWFSTVLRDRAPAPQGLILSWCLHRAFHILTLPRWKNASPSDKQARFPFFSHQLITGIPPQGGHQCELRKRPRCTREVTCTHALTCSTSGPPQVHSERAAWRSGRSSSFRSQGVGSSELQEAFQLTTLTGSRHPCQDVESWVSDECFRGNNFSIRSHAPLAHPSSASSGSILFCVPDPSGAILANARGSSGICTFPC